MATKKNIQEEYKKPVPKTSWQQIVGFGRDIKTRPQLIIGILSFIVIVIVGYFGFRYYINTQDQEGQKDMFQAVRYFESDSLSVALEGDGNYLGFLQIIDEYPWTAAANVANYYAGFIYLKQGHYLMAIEYLKNFYTSDLLIQPHAYSLIGDAYMENKDYENSVTYYQKAVDYPHTQEFTPVYLMKMALAYKKLNQKDKAKETYQILIDKFWNTREGQQARKYKARLSTP